MQIRLYNSGAGKYFQGGMMNSASNKGQEALFLFYLVREPVCSNQTGPNFISLQAIFESSL